MSAVGRAIAEVGEQHERVIAELAEKPMLIGDLAAATGLSDGQLLGVLRVLERGGRVRRTPRGPYELIRLAGTLHDQADPPAGRVATPPEPPMANMRTFAKVTEMLERAPAAAAAPCPFSPPPSEVSKMDTTPVAQPAQQPNPTIEPERQPTRESTMPRGVYDRTKADKPTARAPKTKRGRPPAAADDSQQVDGLKLPACLAVACGINEEGQVQIANSAEHYVTMSPAQMDGVCTWWPRVRGKLAAT